MFRYWTIQEAMTTIEASVRESAPEPQEQTLKGVPALDANDHSTLTSAAHMLPSYGVVPAGRPREASRHQSPEEESAPRQGHRTERNERQRTQE